MSATPVTLRCIRCGRFLVAPSPPTGQTGWVSCPSCGHPMPVVAPRDPPPLFSWEVHPHLYPALPPPGRPGRSLRGPVTALLAVATVLLAGLSVGLVYEGAASFYGGPFAVRGTVDTVGRGVATPIAGATVVAHDEGGDSVWTNTDVAGAFRCAGLAPGRVTVEISDRGYEPVTLVVFVSGPYSTVGADADPVSVALSPALPTSNGSASVLVNETVFGDLESFVASAWSGASLLALGALVSGYSSGLAAQERRPAFVAAGGASALLAPVPLFLLGVTTAFPLTGPFAIAIAGVGVAVASLQIGRSLSIGAPANPD